MDGTLVKVGTYLVNLAAVASAHWEKDRLFVHLSGGRFLALDGAEASALWQTMEADAQVVLPRDNTPTVRP